MKKTCDIYRHLRDILYFFWFFATNKDWKSENFQRRRRRRFWAIAKSLQMGISKTWGDQRWSDSNTTGSHTTITDPDKNNWPPYSAPKRTPREKSAPEARRHRLMQEWQEWMIPPQEGWKYIKQWRNRPIDLRRLHRCNNHGYISRTRQDVSRITTFWHQKLMRSSKKQDKATTKTRQYTTIQYKNNYSFHSHSSKPQNTKPHPPKKQTNTLLHFTTNPYTHKPNNLFCNRLLHQHL